MSDAQTLMSATYAAGMSPIVANLSSSGLRRNFNTVGTDCSVLVSFLLLVYLRFGCEVLVERGVLATSTFSSSLT